MHPLKNFYTRHWAGSSKGVSNRAPHLQTPALPVPNWKQGSMKCLDNEEKSECS